MAQLYPEVSGVLSGTGTIRGVLNRTYSLEGRLAREYTMRGVLAAQNEVSGVMHLPFAIVESVIATSDGLLMGSDGSLVSALEIYRG